jgi:hypothetical protein
VGHALSIDHRGREYLIPVDEAVALSDELGRLAADDSIGDESLAVGCATIKAVIDSSIAGDTVEPIVETNPQEDLALVTAIANMLTAGTAGDVLLPLGARDEGQAKRTLA